MVLILSGIIQLVILWVTSLVFLMDTLKVVWVLGPTTFVNFIRDYPVGDSVGY